MGILSRFLKRRGEASGAAKSSVAKEIDEHVAWLREHADIVELPAGNAPGVRALARVIHEAVLAEREACAKVADAAVVGLQGSADERAREIAAAIRDRT